MNTHEQWENLITRACDSQPAVVPASLKASLKRQLFPRYSIAFFAAQAAAGALLVAGPAVLEMSTGAQDVPLPGIAYGAFGVMTLLWLVPWVWRILARSSSDLGRLSEQIDELFHLNARRRLKTAD